RGAGPPSPGSAPAARHRARAGAQLPRAAAPGRAPASARCPSAKTPTGGSGARAGHPRPARAPRSTHIPASAPSTRGRASWHSRLGFPVPLRPGLRVADGDAVGDVLAGTSQAASWGAAHAHIRLARRQRDRLLALADGGRDPLHVADEARRIACLDGDELDGMLAAIGGAPLRLHLVKPGCGGILGKKRTVDAGKDGHWGILARRSLGAGEALRESARQIQDRQVAGHSKLLTRRDEIDPLRDKALLKARPRVAIVDYERVPESSITSAPSRKTFVRPPSWSRRTTCFTPIVTSGPSTNDPSGR